MTSSPAEGERRAIIGYWGQYRMAALLILQSLREDWLESIRLADPKAERVDDLLIFSQGRVDAYQIKWSQYGGSFTFNNLVRPSDRTPSLIDQLASGWRSLGETYPNRRVVVHLITNETPSTSPNTALPVGSISPTPSHFAAFLNQAWDPAHAIQIEVSKEVPSEWSEAWNALRSATSLSEESFEHFVKDCVFDFASQLPSEVDPGNWTGS